jgi:dTDP-4-dehydrorhamnose 3,5-epimerase
MNMAFSVLKTALPGVLILEPKVYQDERGFFFESFNEREFQLATGLDIKFVQDNHSKSNKGVLRGLHYQLQNPQGKLVRVTQGAVFDVAVDLRTSSDHFGKSFGIELSADNKRQLWIPPGFAHGFFVLIDSTEFMYKATDYWYPEYEKTLLWSDPSIGIQWPITTEVPQVIERDMRGLSLADAPVY